MIKLYAAADLHEAYLISHLLQQAGIDHYISNESLLGGAGELPFTHIYPEIWILDEAKVPAARAILRDYAQLGTTQEVIICPGCGEECPATFDLCWNCGRLIRNG